MYVYSGYGQESDTYAETAEVMGVPDTVLLQMTSPYFETQREASVLLGEIMGEIDYEGRQEGITYESHEVIEDENGWYIIVRMWGPAALADEKEFITVVPPDPTGGDIVTNGNGNGIVAVEPEKKTPTWVWWAAGIAGVVTVGAVAYAMLK